MKRRRKIVFAVVALIAFWFLTVHLCEGFEYCDSCRYDARFLDVQFCGFRLARMHYSGGESLIGMIARDLGAPCNHPNWESAVLKRFWGLCFCPNPHNRTTMTNESGNAYTDNYQASVKTLAIEDPNLANEFHQRVLVEHDFEYFGAFLERVKPLLGPEELQQPD